ncbi:hypothetical protein PPYR_00925 [Photinus pyralis]|uniref:Uncharacterized protein n=1 Tax=Photinus pyralis TaxID=7054 RepID=A0A5N4B302_PHOPY|nr:uncharacterized protein LOC116160509 [Photinus pyralis]KAB0803955.1 hypothetical protein PPYR_00925 [Photinus pyralis]
MKSLLLTVLLVADVIAVWEVELKVREQWSALVQPYESVCECETHIRPDLAYGMFINSHYCNKACVKCYLKCLYFALNLMNPATGAVNEAEFVRQFAGVTPEIAKCCNEEASTTTDPCETAYIMMKCIVKELAVEK